MCIQRKIILEASNIILRKKLLVENTNTFSQYLFVVKKFVLAQFFWHGYIFKEIQFIIQVLK